MNIYLKQYALQNQKKGIVRNYISCRDSHVVVYYSLAYGSAAQFDAPPALTRGIGKYPIPVVILARLAVDLQEKGQGLGKALLKDAILPTLQAADIAGLKAIFVQAKDQNCERSTPSTASSPLPVIHFIFSLRSMRAGN